MTGRYEVRLLRGDCVVYMRLEAADAQTIYDLEELVNEQSFPDRVMRVERMKA